MCVRHGLVLFLAFGPRVACRLIVPMEYGITIKEKIDIGLKIISPMLTKIREDILWWKQEQ